MKVLIISHNPLSTYQSMGKTMLSLFSEFKREELYQLYVYPSVPDVDKCQSYFRITDKAVAKGLFTRKVISDVVKPNLEHHTKFENDEDKKIYSNPKNTGSFRLFVRDLMWEFSPWLNGKLRNWLDEINPECIFLAPGNCAFIYQVALKISRIYGVKMISYICDEYYFINKPKHILERFRSNRVRNKIAETMKKSEGIVTICKELEDEYSKGFGKKTITIMTGANRSISTFTRVKEDIDSITFMGNLSCHRDRAVYDIGQALDEINRERKTEYRLNIYTNITDSMQEQFKGIDSIKLHGFISGEQFNNVFWNSDMFLHVEDFDENSVDRVKHSVSTKIADIMARGIPLFAYGPSTVASMEHLIRNKCAICVVEKVCLKEALIKAFSDKEERENVAFNGIKVAKQYHNSYDNSVRFHQFLEGCLG